MQARERSPIAWRGERLSSDQRATPILGVDGRSWGEAPAVIPAVLPRVDMGTSLSRRRGRLLDKFSLPLPLSTLDVVDWCEPINNTWRWLEERRS